MTPQRLQPTLQTAATVCGDGAGASAWRVTRPVLGSFDLRGVTDAADAVHRRVDRTPPGVGSRLLVTDDTTARQVTHRGHVERCPFGPPDSRSDGLRIEQLRPLDAELLIAAAQQRPRSGCCGSTWTVCPVIST